MTQFRDLLLPESIYKALDKLKFETPTPIQAQSIPVAIEGRDLIACAQTGSGKTAAYAIPLITKLLLDEEACGLILAPTRELAKQISDVVHELTIFTPSISQAVLIGGVDMERQLKALSRGPRIVIATPGRLTDHLRRRSIILDYAKFLVLDEGDRMLDMGFAPQLDVILKYLPKTRQTLLYSATLPPNVKGLAQKYLNHPIHISVGPVSQPVETIKQTGVQTTQAGKNELLLNELNARKGSVIIFARTKHRTDKVARYLEEYGFSVSRIHGDRTQGQRNSALQGFRDGKFRILVATDIAARGIDVPQIEHVINYDLPMMDEDYVHRIGRTARAGASGEALSFLTPEDKRQWIGLARKYKIPGVDVTSRELHSLQGKKMNAGGGSGGASGGRRSSGGGSGSGSGRRPSGGRPQRSGGGKSHRGQGGGRAGGQAPGGGRGGSSPRSGHAHSARP